MQESKKSNTGLIAGIIGGAVAVTAIIVLILVLALGGGSSSIVGTWKVVSAMEKGEVVSEAQMKAAGLDDFEITFESDGTCSAVRKGEKNTGDCKYEDGKLYAGDDDVWKYKLDGGKLTIDISENASMVLEKK
jgi:hypothetical protein